MNNCILAILPKLSHIQESTCNPSKGTYISYKHYYNYYARNFQTCIVLLLYLHPCFNILYHKSFRDL